jgi:hypothetical protein
VGSLNFKDYENKLIRNLLKCDYSKKAISGLGQKLSGSASLQTGIPFESTLAQAFPSLSSEQQ